MVPKGARGGHENTSETCVFVFLLCFYMFFSVWLGRVSAGKGAIPSTGSEKTFDRRVDGFLIDFGTLFGSGFGALG